MINDETGYSEYALLSDVTPLVLRGPDITYLRLNLTWVSRVTWNYLGMVKEIPKPVLRNALSLIDDYAMKQNGRGDSAPAAIRQIFWEQTVPIRE